MVRRLRGSMMVEVAPPRDGGRSESTPLVLPIDSINTAPYCKLFSATEKQVNIFYVSFSLPINYVFITNILYFILELTIKIFNY